MVDPVIKIHPKDKRYIDAYRDIQRRLSNALRPLSQREVMHRMVHESRIITKTERYLKELEKSDPIAARNLRRKYFEL
jgi:hypothetical protein